MALPTSHCTLTAACGGHHTDIREEYDKITSVRQQFSSKYGRMWRQQWTRVAFASHRAAILSTSQIRVIAQPVARMRLNQFVVGVTESIISGSKTA